MPYELIVQYLNQSGDNRNINERMAQDIALKPLPLRIELSPEYVESISSTAPSTAAMPVAVAVPTTAASKINPLLGAAVGLIGTGIYGASKYYDAKKKATSTTASTPATTTSTTVSTTAPSTSDNKRDDDKKDDDKKSSDEKPETAETRAGFLHNMRNAYRGYKGKEPLKAKPKTPKQPRNGLHPFWQISLPILGSAIGGGIAYSIGKSDQATDTKSESKPAETSIETPVVYDKPTIDLNRLDSIMRIRAERERLLNSGK